jgi:hypothetical protein
VKWIVWQIGRHFSHPYRWWEKYAPYKMMSYEDYMIENLGLNITVARKVLRELTEGLQRDD